MKVLISETDIAQKLSQFEGERVVVEISCNDRKKYLMYGGVVEVIHETPPYNPLMDCGTDSIIAKEVKVNAVFGDR
jgi:hypothetical protein